jgi:hypothetical protein
MKTLNFLLVTVIIAGGLASCKKESGASAEDIAKANEFKAYIVNKQFQVREYYSDKPIDYVETDTVVKSETNLWPYVSSWIKDDLNTFDVTSGKVTIVLDFSIGADKTGPYFNFLNYLYNPLKYHLVEFTNSYFLVYVDWHSGAKVYTKFSVIP